MNQREFFSAVGRPCPHPEGTRVELTAPMGDDPCPIPVGSRGTVVGGNGGQLWMQWDDGRTLALLVNHDSYCVVADEDTAPRCATEGHRPDDDPEPGDRCKDCGRDLTWIGPGIHDWELATSAQG